MARVAVLDAGFLIAALKSSDPHFQWAIDVLNDTLSHNLKISSVTLAEVLVHPSRDDRVDSILDNLKTLDIEVVPHSGADAQESARLRVESRLRLPDAIVLQACQRFSGELLTTDAALAAAARKLGLGVFAPAF